ncbi:PREDICTED: uncharacterized protein LOC109226195 [Nicotiana attenuata]|uniref:uncharacterized protein LOC109226195 n=1 Tax=Nicotiana attenuata TaxID=49451 RepID=UPI0009058352|nr:PREDICTED: uncharacterized protein LOC109226195 [Nicotiana attenuata]
MGDKRNPSVEDGVKRVEVQLQNFIEESVKRMDQIEEKQASYDTKMAEVTGNFPTINAGWVQTSQERAEQAGSSSKLPKAKLAFSEFDELNPRSWLRRCDKFFDLYQVSDEEKMTYVSIHLKDYVDNWFDSYLLDRGGKVTWTQFCFDLCQRFGNTQPVQIVAAFNRLEQTTDVDTYKRKFEELRCLLTLINPFVHEAYYVLCFIGGLRPDIQPLVQDVEPKTLMEAYKKATLHEKSFNALYQQLYAKSQSRIHQAPKPTLAITYPKNPHVIHNRNQNPKTMSMETLRENNLCYKCHDKWHPGHQCKVRALNVMEGEEFVDVVDKIDEPEVEVTEEGAEQGAVTLNVMLGHGDSPTTIRIVGWVKGLKVSVLIDSGATHSFVDPQVAKKWAGNVQELAKPMMVRVANGQLLPNKQVCKNFHWEMQQLPFHFDLRILKAGGCDIILGMDWIDSVTPILLHTKPKSITFKYGNEMVTLLGEPSERKLPNVDARAIFKIVYKGQCNFVTQLFLVEDKGAQNEIPKEISEVLGQYEELFQEPKGLPPARDCDHAIELLPGAKPINLRPYRYSFEQKNVIEEIIADMLKAQTVTKSVSPFASPVLLVKKKDASWRMCVDYRKLNEITIKNKYPIPVVEDLLDELHGALFYSKLDLRSGYHQIRMKDGDEFKTAFRTQHGLWEFRVMPFGLTNAPATFQALMHQIFAPFLRRFVLVFFDDILVYSASLTDHVRHLKLVFDSLKANQLFVKGSKCNFGQKKVEYLGHVISSEGISTDNSKVEAILNWAQPKSIKEL